MVSLKTKILILLMIIGLPLTGQSFIYSYIDPCTKQSKFINTDMSAPIVISYYGQVKTFTYGELSDGTFDAWINSIYIKASTASVLYNYMQETLDYNFAAICPEWSNQTIEKAIHIFKERVSNLKDLFYEIETFYKDPILEKTYVTEQMRIISEIAPCVMEQ